MKIKSYSFLLWTLSVNFLIISSCGNAQEPTSDDMKNTSIIRIEPLDFLWPVQDPFLFCAHHKDDYPAGNPAMEPPRESLRGRDIGQDFTLKDGWRMYHGDSVPGFPAHPHRGFETITVVLTGFVDHSDSYGQAGRYGEGDVQWMTAGAGMQHCEMFPLINQEKENPLELFQVWLNLPKASKMTAPYFKMLWNEDIPVQAIRDDNGLQTTVKIITGELNGVKSLSPAPDSWASNPESEIAVWTIRMEPGATFSLPTARASTGRILYFYRGSFIKIENQKIDSYHAIRLDASGQTTILNGDQEGYLFLLQGKPLGEPVAQYGPFVMNTEQEIRQAFEDYRRTEFGGWPWARRDHVHPLTSGRFASYVDGKKEVR